MREYKQSSLHRINFFPTLTECLIASLRDNIGLVRRPKKRSGQATGVICCSYVAFLWFNGLSHLSAAMGRRAFCPSEVV
jgi:drug/metabolite transporter (DMT)-like permease